MQLPEPAWGGTEGYPTAAVPADEPEEPFLSLLSPQTPQGSSGQLDSHEKPDRDCSSPSEMLSGALGWC